MKAPPRLIERGAVVSVLILTFGASLGCDGTEPASRSDGSQRGSGDRSPSADLAKDDPAPLGPRPCLRQSMAAWTNPNRATSYVADGSLGDLVLAPRGTATLAWVSGSKTSRGWQVRTSDLPSSPGDPQVLPGPPLESVPAGARASALFPIGDHLGVDGAGALTAAFHQDLLLASGQTTEDYDLVISDRAPRGTWSSMPHVADDGSIFGTELAVNSSGAAVLAWDVYVGGGFPSFVSYRPAAGAEWTPAERVALRSGSLRDVGIDDAGRLVLLYSTPSEDGMAVRGTPTTGWSRPQPLPGRDMTLAVGAAGAAVVAGLRGAQDRRPYTISMSRSGTWGAPVPQPDADFPGPTVAMDGAGRALYVWWDEQRLMTRWSERGSSWQEPCVLADGVSDPRYFDDVASHVAVNSRGDALVVWRTKDPAPQLWARAKPSGQAWTEPIEVTADTGRLLGEFRAAIGARGHAAIAWTTGNRRQVNLVQTRLTR